MCLNNQIRDVYVNYDVNYEHITHCKLFTNDITVLINLRDYCAMFLIIFYSCII